MKTAHKTPRLYVDQPLSAGNKITLGGPQAHYLKSVLRMEDSQAVRVFNGQHGEWITTITALSKKTATLTPSEKIKDQPNATRRVQLLFTPIKKHRLDFLIEKAVELGATDLHPILTARTQTRKINQERICAQIIEAAEQCERMNLPTLHPLEKLETKIASWDANTPLYWAAERLETARPITEIKAPAAFLIGPEGGFSEDETAFLQTHGPVQPISLGENILRAETAALFCLSHANQ